jgi:hypothetical protein
MNRNSRLHKPGQPPWLDCIRCDPDQAPSGQPAQMADKGESPDETSNPTIFEQMIFEGNLQTACMRPLAAGLENSL